MPKKVTHSKKIGKVGSAEAAHMAVKRARRMQEIDIALKNAEAVIIELSEVQKVRELTKEEKEELEAAKYVLQIKNGGGVLYK